MRDLVIVGYFEIYNKPFDPNNSIEPFKNFLKEHVGKDVLFWNPSEPIGNPFDIYDWDVLYDFEKFLIDNDIVVYGLFGGDTIFKSTDRPIRNYYVLSWNTFLLHYTKYYLEKSYNKDVINLNINTDFNKHFFNLNKHPREQRCISIDHLYKENLFNYGLISWNNLSKNWQNPHVFQYWEEKIMNLDIFVDEIDKVDIHTSLNTDFLLNTHCVFNYVVETMVDNRNTFVTEKTFKNFLLNQPFLSVGSVYHNKTLCDLGFELYGNIFDYSFDKCVDYETRLIHSVNSLKNIVNQDVNWLYESVKETTLRNKDIALKICENDFFIPQELVNLYVNHKEKFDSNQYIKKECDIVSIFKNIL
jgi:hypothetical protein